MRGIYQAKGRPSDNPLIVHVCDLNMLRDVLGAKANYGHPYEDPIPELYKPLIERFWPGPLTILLRNPEHSVLAPEVTWKLSQSIRPNFRTFLENMIPQQCVSGRAGV